MTPQQLIDLTGYGIANKRVKAMGHWRETINDTERIEWLEAYVSKLTLNDDNETYSFVIGGNDCYDVLAQEIDERATQLTAHHYSAKLEEYPCA